jgi:hypothetical protein
MNLSEPFSTLSDEINVSIMTFLISGSTFLKATSFRSVSKRFNELMKPLLKKPTKYLKNIYMLINSQRDLGIKFTQKDCASRLKSLFVKTLSLNILLSLECDMTMYNKSLCFTQMTGPTFKTVDLVSFKQLSKLNLSQVFLSEAVIDVLTSHPSLSEFGLSHCGWEGDLCLRHLKICKLIMHINISKIGKSFDPPLSVEFFELTLTMRGSQYCLRHHSLAIPITDCKMLQYL